jgi:hypothetical protein
MKIGERDASVLLSDEGRHVLQQAALNLEESPFLSGWRIATTSEFGLV